MKALSKKETKELILNNPDLIAKFKCYTNHNFLYEFSLNNVEYTVVCIVCSTSIDSVYLKDKETVLNLLDFDDSYILEK